MNFPMYPDDGISIEHLSTTQQKMINIIKNKIRKSVYTLIETSCLCGNSHTSEDTVVSEKDRYGFPIRVIICSRCGLVRSDRIFDKESNRQFYQSDYRQLYSGETLPAESFFNDQVRRGFRLMDKINPYISNKNTLFIFEIGCGAGGILYPFHKTGHKCCGSDSDIDYLNFGIEKGLDLRDGDFRAILNDRSADLIILSHVLEHFSEPVTEMVNIIEKIKDNGLLMVEVPGIFSLHKTYFPPGTYFQQAHVFYFFKDYLEIFFNMLGLKLLFGDEHCFFILQKPEQWSYNEPGMIFDNKLSSYPEKVRDYLSRTYLSYKFGINPYLWRNRFILFLDKLGIKEFIRKIAC